MKLHRLFSTVVMGAFLMALSAQVSLAALTAEQRLADFTQLVNIIARNYGPLQMKKTSAHLDFNRVVVEYREKVSQAKTDGEFYRTLARFISNLKDAHVTPLIPSTYRARLGFGVDLIQGKVLIEKVDRMKLPEPLFPFNRGDQLLSLGGVPVENLIGEIGQVGHTGFDESNRRIAAARITSRSESSGLEVPKGVTTITVLPKGAAKPITVTATWILTGTPIVDLDDLGNLSHSVDLGAVATAADGNELLASLKKLPMYNLKLPVALLEDMRLAGISDIGNPKSMFKLPANAKELPGFPVTAAIYEAAGKKIGILRINEYGDEAILEVIARALMEMERETDVLVIDQTNNPGGQVSLCSDIAGLFADKSFVDMSFALRPSLEWLKSFQDFNVKIAEMLKADPDDMAANALNARFAYLESEVRDAIAQRKFLTAPVSLNLTGTFGMIQPNSAVSYSKPILLLINEFDFSGGDLFPAIMKDNGRVTLFGTRTTGAGGSVGEYGPLSNSYFKLQLTESLMVRPNGEYVENFGVKPDVEYRVTEADFNNDYQDYVKAFTVEALRLAGTTQEEIQKYKLAQ